MALRRPFAMIALIGIPFLAGCSGKSSGSLEDPLNPDPIVPATGIEVAPATLEFGDVLLESSRSLDVSIHNTGAAQVEVSAIDLAAATGRDFVISSGPESVSLAPDATVKDAARLRGSAAGAGPVLAAVMVKAVKTIPALAMALESRGLGRPGPRSSLVSLGPSRRFALHAAAVAVATAAVLLALLLPAARRFFALPGL